MAWISKLVISEDVRKTVKNNDDSIPGNHGGCYCLVSSCWYKLDAPSQ